jgi:hypothetical protein
MCKNIYFSGQPLYAQLLKLTDRQEIARISRKGSHDRYVKKLNGYSHFLIMLYAVLMRYDFLREIVVEMLSESNKINHLSINYMVKRSTLAEAVALCKSHQFNLLPYFFNMLRAN